jgi:FixJ family two-component response regulator
MLSRSEEFTERLGLFCASRPALRSAPVRANALPINVRHVDAAHARNSLIAIVDDDQWAREGMNSFVASLGYFGAMFMSAEEYLGSNLKQRAECLILDVHLCGMSGPDLQARLRAEGYRTPIIFMTAKFEARVRDRVMGAGALGYLTKPCDENILINCLERAVGR